MIKFFKWISNKISDYKRKKIMKKKIELLKKSDPFTYNH